MKKKTLITFFLGVSLLAAGCSVFDDYNEEPEFGRARMNKSMDYKNRAKQFGTLKDEQNQ
jgi:hypothetical protein